MIQEHFWNGAVFPDIDIEVAEAPLFGDKPSPIIGIVFPATEDQDIEEQTEVRFLTLGSAKDLYSRLEGAIRLCDG